MDSMEINKLVGAAVGALLIFTGANFFSELYYEGPGDHGHAEYAYAIDAGEADHGAAPAAEQIDFGALMAAADAGKGEKIFGKCKACHKIEAGANGTGPTLHSVVGRAVGTEAGFTYSDTLAHLGGNWDAERLSHFLESPKGYAPGTKMGFAGLKKPEDRADLIAYLETLSN